MFWFRPFFRSGVAGLIAFLLVPLIAWTAPASDENDGIYNGILRDYYLSKTVGEFVDRLGRGLHDPSLIVARDGILGFEKSSLKAWKLKKTSEGLLLTNPEGFKTSIAFGDNPSEVLIQGKSFKISESEDPYKTYYRVYRAIYGDVLKIRKNQKSVWNLVFPQAHAQTIIDGISKHMSPMATIAVNAVIRGTEEKKRRAVSDLHILRLDKNESEVKSLYSPEFSQNEVLVHGVPLRNLVTLVSSPSCKRTLNALGAAVYGFQNKGYKVKGIDCRDLSKDPYAVKDNGGENPLLAASRVHFERKEIDTAQCRSATFDWVEGGGSGQDFRESIRDSSNEEPEIITYYKGNAYQFRGTRKGNSHKGPPYFAKENNRFAVMASQVGDKVKAAGSYLVKGGEYLLSYVVELEQRETRTISPLDRYMNFTTIGRLVLNPDYNICNPEACGRDELEKAAKKYKGARVTDPYKISCGVTNQGSPSSTSEPRITIQ